MADWISRFEQDYFTRRGCTDKTQTTWKTDYLAVFKHLPGHLPLTSDLLEQAVKQTPPNTRTRRRWVQACQALANFAGLSSIDLKPLRGNYSHRSVGERELPTDEQIVITREQIKNPHWRWVYGVLAAYGLRPHEVFHLEWSDFPQLRVTDGKTGSRLVYPLYPEWATQWCLDQEMLPPCSGATNRDLGQRVTQAFRRANVPFTPYALRHCWAIRAIQFNLPIALAARMMGHSVEVHTQTYHRWITADLYQQEYNRVCRAPDRPTPPLANLALTKS
ncbi:MAG: site-specific integrase [Gloeomargarita sp. SKYG98]|nr:site-specific integrase [Gloeomargarita sp. SKYG98]